MGAFSLIVVINLLNRFIMSRATSFADAVNTLNWDCDSDEEQMLLRDVEDFATADKGPGKKGEVEGGNELRDKGEIKRTEKSAIEEMLERDVVEVVGSTDDERRLETTATDDDSEIDVESQCWKRRPEFRKRAHEMSDPKFIWSGASVAFGAKLDKTLNVGNEKKGNNVQKDKRKPAKKKKTEGVNRILVEYGGDVSDLEVESSTSQANSDARLAKADQLAKNARTYQDCRNIANQCFTGRYNRFETSLTSQTPSPVVPEPTWRPASNLSHFKQYLQIGRDWGSNSDRSIVHPLPPQHPNPLFVEPQHQPSTECMINNERPMEHQQMVSPYNPHKPNLARKNSFGWDITPSFNSEHRQEHCQVYDSNGNYRPDLLAPSRLKRGSGYEMVPQHEMSAFAGTVQRPMQSPSPASIQVYRPSQLQDRRDEELRMQLPPVNRPVRYADSLEERDDGENCRRSYMSALRESIFVSRQMNSVNSNSHVSIAPRDAFSAEIGPSFEDSLVGQCKCLVGNLPDEPNIVSTFRQMLVNFRVEYSCYRLIPREGRAMVTLVDRLEADRFSKLCNSFSLGNHKLESVIVS